jgi:hypothetical protein
LAHRAGSLTGLAPIADRLARKSRLGEMMGNDLGETFGHGGEPFHENALRSSHAVAAAGS